MVVGPVGMWGFWGWHPLLGRCWATRWPRDEFTHLADPVHAPDPITPRVLVGHTGIYYGTGGSPVTTADNLDPSIVLYVDGDNSHLPRQVDPDCVNIANSYAVLTASDPIHGRSVNDAPHKLLLFPIKRGSCLGRHKKCRTGLGLAGSARRGKGDAAQAGENADEAVADAIGQSVMLPAYAKDR